MTDIFTPVATTTQQPNETQQTQDFYSELVGDGKKFKDNEALARSKYEADQHIDRLQKEMKGLREDLNARLTLEALVDKLEQRQTQPQQGNLDNTNARTPSGTDIDQSNINPQLIDSLVDKKLSDFEKSRRRSENAALVQKELRDRFGDNYVVHLENEAQKMGVGKEFLNNLAAEEPRAFLQLFPNQRQQNVDLNTSPRSSVQSAFKPSNNSRTEKYYEQLRKDNPKLYWDPKTQMQLHSDALQQGENFFDTEY